MKYIPILFLSVFIGMYASTHNAYAQKPSFIFPLDCTLDKDCWLVNYVDTDPDKDKVSDFTCGPQSYDGHKGTDFAVRSRAEMRSGVNVLAAKDGKILRLRDGESDSIKSKADIEKLREMRKECGNGVFIDHGGAVQTIYCHMKEGSITVKTGDKVASGDIIGQIGQSGLAEFPHLHFGIVWEGGIIDPFTGQLNTDGCGKYKGALWADQSTMKYDPISIYDGGFLDGIPNFKNIEDGAEKPLSLDANGDALVFWAAFYGVRKDDKINMKILDPQGRIFKQQNIIQEKPRARQYYYTGRELKGRSLPNGSFKGIVTLERLGLETQIEKFTIHIK